MAIARLGSGTRGQDRGKEDGLAPLVHEVVQRPQENRWIALNIYIYGLWD